MNKLAWITLGTVAATGGAVAGASYVYRRQQAAHEGDAAEALTAPPSSSPPPSETPIPMPKPSSLTPLQWEALPLPKATDVKGDLNRNWGRTPLDLRPLLLLAEETSGIVGAGRILAIIASRESRFEPTAHNGDAPGEEAERNASWRAYQQNKARNPPLAFGEVAAAFGSGGLFGALAPYFLWTGVQELGPNAPLLNADPRVMFVPRVATFAACVFLARLLKNYDVQDLPDIKVGWGSVSLLKGEGRGSETYQGIRTNFVADAAALGIDLADAATIPPRLTATNWPGVAKVFERIVGKLPTPRAVS
jgi:hypothetical protein